MPDAGIQDKIRNALLAYGEQEVHVTVDDLVGKTGLTGSQVYQTLYRMENGTPPELQTIKERQPSGQKKIVAIKLLKMEPKERVNGRVMEAQVKHKTENALSKFNEQIPNTISYIKKKIGIEKAALVLREHGLDETALKFEPDPLGEEAIVMLQKLEEQASTISQQKIELDIANRQLQIMRAKEPTVANDKRIEKVPVSASNDS